MQAIRIIRPPQLFGAALLLLALALTIASVPVEARPQSPPRLHLHRGSFDARVGTPALTAAPALDEDAPGVAIIQFDGPVGAQQRTALLGAGVAILEYIPDNAFLVRGDEAQLAAAAALPGVYARASLRAADKLAPALLAALSAGALSQPAAVSLSAWPGQESDLAAQLAAQGIDPSQPLTPAQILVAAGLPAARWLQPTFRPHLLNDSARSIIGVNGAWANHGLYGAGQVVGIADSGIDTGDPNTISPDFAGRIVATHILSDGGTLADEFGHGTHVAGSLAGSGVDSGARPDLHQFNGSFAGMAPDASLVIQAFEVDATSGQIIGISDDPYPIFAQAYADGARIHSDSWGGPSGLPLFNPHYFGGYPTQSQRTDQFVWEHPDMTIFVAAGNNGHDSFYFLGACLFGGDGVIDLDSLAAPGTAKNVITVGASENVRFDGKLKTLTWKDFDSRCYGNEPIASDLLSDNPNGMAPFSSRGPVDDGRVKPDLAAPGTSIISDRSHVPGANPLWGIDPSNPNYVASGGTSMATPIAAGAGALVREWLIGQGLANPSAAALKAVLLNTTADMAPGQYGAGSLQEIPTARPNSVAGWGRVDLRFLDSPAPYRLWLDDHRAGVGTGDVVSYAHSATRPLAVTSSDQPLRVMLTWTDPPPSPSAAIQLVNDLDLVVRSPDGREYHGNDAAAGDRLNNVEGLVIASPPVGLYHIEVRAHNIPVGAQPYALAVAGPIGGASTLGLAANTGLGVDEGATAIITATQLQVTSTAAGPARVGYTLTRPPAHGTLLVGGAVIGALGTFTQADIDAGHVSYTHDGSETLSDSLGISVADGLSAPLTGLEFTIGVRPLNDPPVTRDDVASTQSGLAVSIAVLANDSDAEGDALSLSAVTSAAHGAVTILADAVIYTPQVGFSGEDAFSYTARDAAGATTQGRVSVTVRAIGGAPGAQLYLPLIAR